MHTGLRLEIRGEVICVLAGMSYTHVSHRLQLDFVVHTVVYICNS